MIINKIEIYGFGKWHNKTFDNINHNFQVFFGNNEAGKSTIRQFIYSILFGFPNNRGNNKFLRYVPKNHNIKAYGGNIVVTYNNQSYKIERLGDKKNNALKIYRTKDGKIVSNEFLKEILGSLDENTYRILYGFNQDDIDKLDNIKNRDDLRSYILRMGAVGSDEWINYENDLNKKAKQIYTTSSRTRPLDKKIKNYNDYMEIYQDNLNKMPKVDEITKYNENINRQITDTREEIETLIHHQNDLTRFINEWHDYQKIKSIKKYLVNVPECIKKIDFATTENTLKKISDLQNEIRDIEQQLEKIKSDSIDDSKLEKLLDLKRKIIEVKFMYSQRDEMEDDLSKLNNDADKIKSKYEFKITDIKPLSSTDQTIISNSSYEKLKLSDDLAKEISVDNNSNHFILLIGILLVLAIGSFQFNLFGTLICLVGIIYGFIQLKNANQAKLIKKQQIKTKEERLRQIDDSIQKIRSNNNLENVPFEEWLAVNQDVKNLADLNDKIKSLNHKLLDNKESLNEFWMNLRENKINYQKENVSEVLVVENKIDADIKKIQQYQMVVQQKNILTENKVQKSKKQFTLENGLNQEIKDYIKSTSIEETLRYLNDIHSNLQELTLVENHLDDDEIQKLRAFKNLDEIKNDIENNRQELTKKQANLNNLIDEKTEKIGKITGLEKSFDDSLSLQRIEDQKNDILDTISEWLKYKLGGMWVDKTLEIATKGRLPLVIKQAGNFFELLTNNNYHDLKFDKNDNLLISDKNNNSFVIEELSKGTKEQLYIALRLSFMKNFLNEVNVPLIIDDAFVAFDEIRTKNIINLLNVISKDTQIIFFTAKKDNLNIINNDFINLNEV